VQGFEAWRRIGLEQNRSHFDSDALGMAERKEAYLTRRKELSQKMRMFSGKYLSATPIEADVLDALKADARALIDTFKKEFDFLSNSAKQTEASFVALYQVLRDAPDPQPLLEQVLQWYDSTAEELVSTRQALAVSQEAAAALESKIAEDRVVGELKRNLEEAYENKRLEERDHLEEEFRRREMALRNSYESHDSDVQQSYQAIVSEKDDEIASLTSALQQANQAASLNEEMSAMILEKSRKSEALEVKVTDLSNELVSKLSKIESLESQLLSLRNQMQITEAALVAERKERAELTESTKRQSHAMQSTIDELRSDLAARPKVDLSPLAVRLGMSLSEGPLVWPEVEEFVLKAVKTSSAEASEARAQVHDTQQTVRDLTRSVSELRDKLGTRDALIASLERDVQAAQRSLANIDPKHSNHMHSPRTLDERLDLEAGTPTDTQSSDVGASLMMTMQGQRDRLGKLAHEHEKEAIQLRSELDRLREEFKELQNDNTELFKRLRLARASNTQAAASGLGNRSGGGSSRISAVDDAEDVPSMGVDSRGNPIKPRYSKKRQGGGFHWNYSEGGLRSSLSLSNVLSSLASRGAGKASDRLSDLDALEGKYCELYEAQLDPFRVEEIDKQIVLSRLNTLDWAFANVSKLMLRDPWSRHVLMTYLLVVHLFALGYVIRVLNPEIEAEITGQVVDAATNVFH
jgi:phage shock protein A